MKEWRAWLASCDRSKTGQHAGNHCAVRRGAPGKPRSEAYWTDTMLGEAHAGHAALPGHFRIPRMTAERGTATEQA